MGFGSTVPRFSGFRGNHQIVDRGSPIRLRRVLWIKETCGSHRDVPPAFYASRLYIADLVMRRKLRKPEGIRECETEPAPLCQTMAFGMTDQVDPFHEMEASGSRLTILFLRYSSARARLDPNTNGTAF